MLEIWYNSFKLKEVNYMGFLCVVATFVLSPILLFNPEFDGYTRAVAFGVFLFLLVFVLFCIGEAQEVSTPKGREKVIKKTKELNDYTNEYGLIEWDDKK